MTLEVNNWVIFFFVNCSARLSKYLINDNVYFFSFIKVIVHIRKATRDKNVPPNKIK